MFIHNYNIIDNILLTCFLYDLLIPQRSVQLLTELGVMRLIDLYYTVVLLKHAEKCTNLILQLKKKHAKKCIYQK